MLLSVSDLFARPPVARRPLTESFALELDEAMRQRLKKPKAPAPPKPTAPAPAKPTGDTGDGEAKRAAAAKVQSASDERTREKSSSEKAAATRAQNQKAATKAALGLARERRQARKQALAAKSRDVVQSKANATGKADKVNAQLAHCMLALNKKRGKDAKAAWNICRWSLTKYGYLKPPYRKDGKVDTVHPTQKGSRRAMQHAYEKKPLGGGVGGSPGAKYASFKDLFREIEPAV